MFAHQGSNARFAPQTRAAYLQALTEGADGLECDVHLTADGQVVCCHDETVDRTSNGSGRIRDLTLAQLRALDFASWQEPEIPSEYGTLPEQFLTLGELYDIAAGAGRPTTLLVEIKPSAFGGQDLEEAVLGVLAARGWTVFDDGVPRVEFMSFDPRCVRRLVEQVAPERVCQLLQPTTVSALLAAPPTLVAGAVGARLLDKGVCQVAGPSVEYCRARPDQVHAWLVAGRRVRVWTANDPVDVAFLRDLGVRELITDHPGAVRAML